MFENIIILGGGCWGATIAEILAENSTVTLWEYSLKKYNYLKKNFHPQNFPYVNLRKVKIKNVIKIASGTNLVVVATPAQNVRATLVMVSSEVKKYSVPVLILSKGVEITTMKSMDMVCEDVLGRKHPIAVCSGPSHAEELCRRRLTSVVIASKNATLAKKLVEIFKRPYLRPYMQTDIRGVALGGALKNVIAIAAGICDGLGLGINAKAALLTRGLAEMVRVGVSMGGELRTFSGLSGVGDLMVTSFSQYSRNRNLGEALGKGLTLDAAKKKIKTTAEGAETAKALYKLTRSSKIPAPITEEVYRILYKKRPPATAIEKLMQRPVKSEEE
ncbi:MAG: glycerol-3-phosphate dehydrogenase [Elusimicrobia bacterium CG08_land_8_20_14_0_20_44_26]|nr:MAG: glycerol-3-phosphate dehydrogenase [Elusimicrobia bacterium CG08_land_8_20_14_0_20_44_26]